MNQFHLVWNKALLSNKLFIGFYFKHEYDRQNVGQDRCVQIQLQWSFFSYLSEALATTV